MPFLHFLLPLSDRQDVEAHSCHLIPNAITFAQIRSLAEFRKDKEETALFH